MSQYKKPEIQYIVNSVMEYISDKRGEDPWTYNGKGFEIDHSSWPVRLQDLITEKKLDFDEDELCYRVDEWREGSYDGYEIRRRNATGGDYVDFDQILGIRGKIGLKVDPATDNSLIVDYESTELDAEIAFNIKGGRSHRGETPPF
jgi:hypothetical protein